MGKSDFENSLSADFWLYVDGDAVGDAAVPVRSANIKCVSFRCNRDRTLW